MPSDVDAGELRRIGEDAGLDEVGFASAAPFVETRAALEERKAAGLHGGMAFTYRNPARSTDPAATLPGARTLVVGARSYLRRPPEPEPEPEPDLSHGRVSARVARYSWEDHYRPLRSGLDAIAQHLAAAGWTARVLADDNALVDRAAAVRAGLGWFGKNANVLLPGRGSWFVLGSVLTDAPIAFAPAAPTQDGCGTCTRCLPACPTGAIVAPGVLDARRCLAWLLEAPGTFPREHRSALGDRIYGCDDCQEVCPPNRGAARGEVPVASPEAQAWVDVLEILSLDDGALLDRYGRWYIPRREPRYIRRNALVVLGNVGDGRASAVVEVLVRALGDDDPVVRGHAVWAARRLGRDDLIARLVRDERHPDVVAELEGDVEVGGVAARRRA